MKDRANGSDARNSHEAASYSAFSRDGLELVVHCFCRGTNFVDRIEHVDQTLIARSVVPASAS